MTNNKSQRLENRIMPQIKSGRVKMRSKYIFLTKKLGLNSGLALTIMLAILFFSLLFFYMRTTDNLDYLSFGQAGILAFLESFPYLLVIVFIVLLFVAGYLITKTEWSYKKPFKYLAVSLVIFVLIVGSLMAYTDVSQKIEEQAFTKRIPGTFFRPFMNKGIERRGRGIAGKIYEIGDNYLILETPHGFEKVSLLELQCQNSDLPGLSPRFGGAGGKADCQNQFKIGQFVIAIGRRLDNVFMADKVRIAGEDKFPSMIKRGIKRRFGPFFDNHPTNTPPLPPHLLNFDQPTNECLKQCFDNKVHPGECFDRCVK